MKKLFILLVVITSLSFVSCSSNNEILINGDYLILRTEGKTYLYKECDESIYLITPRTAFKELPGKSYLKVSEFYKIENVW